MKWLTTLLEMLAGVSALAGMIIILTIMYAFVKKTTTEITKEENRKERNKTTSKGRKED